jgi:hypothetical protein
VATNQLCAKRIALVLVPPLYQFFPVGPPELLFHTAFLPATAAAQHLSRGATTNEKIKPRANARCTFGDCGSHRSTTWGMGRCGVSMASLSQRKGSPGM